MREMKGLEEAMNILKPYWGEIEQDFQRKNSRFLAVVAADHDAIRLVLRSHLVVENFLNSFLQETFELTDFDEL